MRYVDAILSVLAVGSLLVGVAIVLVPGLAGVAPVDDPFIVALGAIALVLGVVIAKRRMDVRFDLAEPPVPERPATFPVPGDDVDELIADVGLTVPHRSTADPRRRLRQRLEAAAIEALTIRQGLSAEEASAQLAAGDWTTDPHAVAFFTGHLPEWTSLSTRVKIRLAVRDPYARRARHAASAIAEIAEVDT